MSMVVPRAPVIGIGISACDFEAAARTIVDAQQNALGGYVCFVSAHGCVESNLDPSFRATLNGSLLNLADGKPVHWVARHRRREATHLPGPDFMPRFLERFPHKRHFFYGSRPEVLERLQASLRERIPDLNVCGVLAPPFRPLTDAEANEHLQQMRDAGAEFVWVGLGAPKQERWMNQVAPQLRQTVFLGVGAAFDFHAGTLQRAPRFVRDHGFEWLFRLLKEPRRLWKRYLVTNSLFMYFAARELAGAQNKT